MQTAYKVTVSAVFVTTKRHFCKFSHRWKEELNSISFFSLILLEGQYGEDTEEGLIVWIKVTSIG